MEVRRDTRRRGALVQELAFELDLLALQLRLSGLHFPFGIDDDSRELRVAELEDDRVLLHLIAGVAEDALDATLRHGGDPANLLGDERAGAADLAQHLAAFHRVDPERALLHPRRGGLHAREAVGDERSGGDQAHADQETPLTLRASDRGWAFEIHDSSG